MNSVSVKFNGKAYYVPGYCLILLNAGYFPHAVMAFRDRHQNAYGLKECMDVMRYVKANVDGVKRD